jgi:hypothetical protein
MIQLNALRCLALITAIAFLSTSVLAAKPVEDWNRTYGGPYGDGAWSLQGTGDGGYLITGYTSSLGQSSDLWLVKVDSLGKEQWDKTFGGSGEDVGYSVKQTMDGGYVVAGTTKSYGMGSEYLWLLKTDTNGTKLWDKTFGGFVSSSGDGAWSVDEAKDGGYIVTGYTKSFGAGAKDLWLVKTDSRGLKQWDRTFGGSKDDVGMSGVQTRDGGYVVTGRTASYGAGKDDVWLIKTDSAGREQWNRTFGGPEDDVGLQVLEIRDGYVITGRTESEGAGKKAFLLKTDLRGKKLWEKVYGQDSTSLSIQQTSDGGFVLAGYIESNDTGRDAWLVKTEASGQEQWNMRLGGTGQDMATSVVESSDGGYVVSGITNSYRSGAEDAWLVKVRLENATSNANAGYAEEISTGNVATPVGNVASNNQSRSTQDTFE